MTDQDPHGTTGREHRYRRPGRRATATLTGVVAALAALIGMAEVERLIRDLVTTDSYSAGMSDVLGPFALTNTGQDESAWAVWARLPGAGPGHVAALIGWHTLFDAVFVLAYWFVIRSVLRPIDVRSTVWRWSLRLLVTVEIIEGVGLAVLALLLTARPTDGAVLAFVTTAKWVLVAVLAVAVVRTPALRRHLSGGLRRAASAIWVQRLSAVSVLVLGVLGLAPAGDVFDQMPDAQRAWLDGGAGALHPWAALLVVVGFAAVLLVQGRARARRAWRTEVEDDPPAEPGWHFWWLVAPVGVGVAAVCVTVRYWPAVPVDPQALSVFLAVPSGLVLVSALLIGDDQGQVTARERRDAAASGVLATVLLVIAAGLVALPWWLDGEVDAAGVTVLLVAAVAAVVAFARRGRPVWSRLSYARSSPVDRPDPEARKHRADDVRRAGDLLALAMVVVAGLGLVRSFVAPVLDPEATLDGRWGLRLALAVVGFGIALAVPAAWVALSQWVDADVAMGEPDGGARPAPLLRRLLRPECPDWVRGHGPRAWVLRRIPVAFGAGAVGLLSLLVLDVRGVTGVLGVVGTTVAALGSWAVLLGFFVVYLQDRRPLAVFRTLRMSANPVLTLTAVVLLISSLSGGDPDLHALRAAPTRDAPAVEAAGLEATFDRWVAGGAACPSGGGSEVRPMILVAASGGGIRAAVWTAGVMEELRGGSGGCTPVLLSSGVSGGSVGLVLSRHEAAPEAARYLAEPAALSAAIAGALVGDVAAGLTGVRLPSGGSTVWRDRAGLMESAWEEAVGGLAEPFDGHVQGPAGALILNSTAAGPGCRVLVSQIDLPSDPEPFDCRGDLGGRPAVSLDLDAYRSCLPSMTWATAAMLSARFPFVTPAGRVDCRAARAMVDPPAREPGDLQLVDGGYAEGSGVATVADLAPAVTALVRGHNATVPAGGPFVVPYVLYLEDETRTEVAANAPDLAPELLVPAVGRDAAAQLTRTDAWLQRAADAVADPCPPRVDGEPDRCHDAVATARADIPGGVVVAAPSTRPGVSSPLGWTLSSDSLTQLREGLDDQRSCVTDRPPDAPQPQYACLETLLGLLGRA